MKGLFTTTRSTAWRRAVLCSLLAAGTVFGAVTAADTTTATTVVPVTAKATMEGAVTATTAVDTTNMTPGNDTGIVTTRISKSAPPVTNKAVRQVSNDAMRDAVTIVAPDANAYYNRLSVTVSPVSITGDRMHITYPKVTSVSPVVTRAMNKVIESYVRQIQDTLAKNNTSGQPLENLYLTYDIKADDKGIFSVLLKSYTIADGAAHGMNTVKAFTFNTSDGRTLRLRDFGSVSTDRINKALKTSDGKWNNQVFADYQGVKSVPDEFYADGDHNITIIFQQGTIGPSAAGTIYVPLGKIGR